MHHLWARAHLTVLEIRFFGAVVVASIILFRLVITVAKIRFSEQKTKIFLSFFEREYLRGKASEIVLFRENSKFPLRILFPPSLHSAPLPQQGGAGGGSLYPFVSVCQRSLSRPWPLVTGCLLPLHQTIENVLNV